MAHIQDRGKQHERRWQARYLCDGCERYPGGGEHSKAFRRKAGRPPSAQAWLDEETAKLVRGDWIDPAARKVTLRTFADGWLQARTVDAPTRDAMSSRLRTHVYPHLGDLELRSIRPSTVQTWVSGRSQELAPSYVGLILGHVWSILSAAVDDGIIARNPCASRSVKAPRADRRRVVPWTIEQVDAIIAGHPERYTAVPVVAAGSGMRQGEVFASASTTWTFSDGRSTSALR